MYCKLCGKLNDEEAKYCVACGQQIQTDAKLDQIYHPIKTKRGKLGKIAGIVGLISYFIACCPLTIDWMFYAFFDDPVLRNISQMSVDIVSYLVISILILVIYLALKKASLILSLISFALFIYILEQAFSGVNLGESAKIGIFAIGGIVFIWISGLCALIMVIDSIFEIVQRVKSKNRQVI